MQRNSQQLASSDMHHATLQLIEETQFHKLRLIQSTHSAYFASTPLKIERRKYLDSIGFFCLLKPLNVFWSYKMAPIYSFNTLNKLRRKNNLIGKQKHFLKCVKAPLSINKSKEKIKKKKTTKPKKGGNPSTLTGTNPQNPENNTS